MEFTEKDVRVVNDVILVNKIGRIASYSEMDKAILLDKSMKWIVGTAEKIVCIDCNKDDIIQKICELLNNADQDILETFIFKPRGLKKN